MTNGSRLIRLIGAAAVVIIVVGVLTLFVFPTRTYLAQRHQIAVASARLRILSSQNAQLSARVDELHTDAEIKRIARKDYHLVPPGAKAIAILPPPALPAQAVVPAALGGQSRHGFLQRSWHRMTSWL